MNRIIKKLLNPQSVGLLSLVFVLLIMNIGAFAQNVKFSSAYTDMKTACKADGKDENNGQDVESICKGLSGYKVKTSTSAFFVAYRLEKGDTTIDLGRDMSPLNRIEWRLANGKPFAVIIRLNEYAEDFGDDGRPVKTGQNLRIIGLAGSEHIDFKVAASSANANAKARKMADSNLVKK